MNIFCCQVYTFISQRKFVTAQKVVDIVLVHPLHFNEAYSNRIIYKADTIEIPTASIDDIITMKKSSGGPRDLSDIDMLEMTKKIIKDQNA